ncbi:uncharacterized protein LOC121777397 isoform X2 [Salvia splendens]|uniref:uncharacterized protein LOC121777397 isoform X2 n=1 Tax=Salvia splendens TaxID=180675 RepID=UPI001C260A7C|nr:uncharacterized protein LOC121777397 isoform X2 [Salvia splendens]
MTNMSLLFRMKGLPHPPSSLHTCRLERTYSQFGTIFSAFSAYKHVLHTFFSSQIHSQQHPPSEVASNGKRKLTYEGSLSGVASARQADKVKGDQTRRSWTKREEEALLVALHDLVAGGWKSDNEFRNGYATREYKVMKRKIPDTQLKADSSVKTMHNKSWPYWEGWKSIFGKDRGNVVRAEDLTQADELLNGNDISVADESQPNMAPYTVEDFFTGAKLYEEEQPQEEAGGCVGVYDGCDDEDT